MSFISSLRSTKCEQPWPILASPCLLLWWASSGASWVSWCPGSSLRIPTKELSSLCWWPVPFVPLLADCTSGPHQSSLWNTLEKWNCLVPRVSLTSRKKACLPVLSLWGHKENSRCKTTSIPRSPSLIRPLWPSAAFSIHTTFEHLILQCSNFFLSPFYTLMSDVPT